MKKPKIYCLLAIAWVIAGEAVVVGQAPLPIPPLPGNIDSSKPQRPSRDMVARASALTSALTPQKVQIDGVDGVEVGLRAVASGCDVEPIRMRSIPDDTCSLVIDMTHTVANGMFPVNSIVVKKDGEYDITFAYSPLASNEPVTALAQISTQPASGVSIDVKENTKVNLSGDLHSPEGQKGAKRKIMKWFYEAAKNCTTNVQGASAMRMPCDGFDIAVGDNSDRHAQSFTPLICPLEPSKPIYWTLQKDKVYFVRIIENTSIARWVQTPAPTVSLAIRQRCCGSSTLINWQALKESASDPSTCPCAVNPDSTQRKMLSSIYQNDIESVEHRKIQLLKADLLGAEDYKFSFDPSFAGQIVFYKSDNAQSSGGLTAIASQAFNPADGMTDIHLDDLGDCSTIFMALATDPCETSDFVATVSPD